MRARSGALAVLGNHDHWVDAETGRWWLSQNGIGIVENRHRVFEDERGRLVVAGVGDLWEGQQDLGLPPSRARHRQNTHPASCSATILTSRSIRAWRRHRVSLLLCGHTHGGQVYIPGLGAPVLPIRHEGIRPRIGAHGLGTGVYQPGHGAGQPSGPRAHAARDCVDPAAGHEIERKKGSVQLSLDQRAEDFQVLHILVHVFALRGLQDHRRLSKPRIVQDVAERRQGPASPAPMWSCQSTRKPNNFLQSLKWKHLSRSNPNNRSNSAIVAA